jgi:hypothetical protein
MKIEIGFRMKDPISNMRILKCIEGDSDWECSLKKQGCLKSKKSTILCVKVYSNTYDFTCTACCENTLSKGIPNGLGVTNKPFIFGLFGEKEKNF